MSVSAQTEHLIDRKAKKEMMPQPIQEEQERYEVMRVMVSCSGNFFSIGVNKKNCVTAQTRKQ